MGTGPVAGEGGDQPASARVVDGPGPESVVLERELRDLLGGV
jgi:hypothetical protein